jgi:hypothetical protein
MHPTTSKLASEVASKGAELANKFSIQRSAPLNLCGKAYTHVLMGYSIVLDHAFELFEKTKLSCKTDSGRDALSFVIAVEAGKFSAGRNVPHAELFKELVSPLYEIACSEELLDDTVNKIGNGFSRRLQKLANVACNNPVLGIATSYALFGLYDTALREHIYELAWMLELNPDDHPYFIENTSHNIGISMNALLSALDDEIAAADPNPSLGKVNFVVRCLADYLNEKFIISHRLRSPKQAQYEIPNLISYGWAATAAA